MYEWPKTTIHKNKHNVGSGGASVSEMPGRAGTDANLMKRITSNADRSALADIAVHYGPRLKAFLVHRGEESQTAEDVVQDVFILVWTKATQFDPAKGSFSSWVYRMTRNKWIDHKRKQGHLQPTSPEIISVMADHKVEPTDFDYEKTEAAEAVRKHMAKLPADQKQMLQLAFFEGLSHSQISDRTGLALGTVKGRIRASLKKMRPGLQNYQGVDQ